MKRSLLRLVPSLAMLCTTAPALTAERGLVESIASTNVALLVGVSHGLSGIDIDINNLEDVAKHSAYQFRPFRLQEAQGTVARVAAELTRLAADARDDGTVFFYYSGHGSVGSIYLQDRSMKITEIRAALEQGRKNLGPVARLVLMFDSCHAGSLIDPVRAVLPPLMSGLDDTTASQIFADSVAEELSESNARAPYWKKLFVFASSRADESSLASDKGSIFTLALMKAYKEVMESNDTIQSWITKTQTYTEGHHPVARLAPTTLGGEKMAP